MPNSANATQRTSCLPGAPTDNMMVAATSVTSARLKQATRNSSESRTGRPDALLRETSATTAARATTPIAAR